MNIPGVEDSIETGMREQGGGRVTVDCPENVEWRTGGDFHCIAKDPQGNAVRVTVTMENDDGEVTWQVGG